MERPFNGAASVGVVVAVDVSHENLQPPHAHLEGRTEGKREAVYSPVVVAVAAAATNVASSLILCERAHEWREREGKVTTLLSLRVRFMSRLEAVE